MTVTIMNYAQFHLSDMFLFLRSATQDWIGLSSVLRPRQHSIGYMGDGCKRQNTLTNSIKVLKEHTVHR